MGERKRLAVVILTKNEEKHIAACMASAAFADEILVIDSGSTDGTQAIAEAHGARFIPHPMTDEGFAGQRNFALTQTQADWVLYLDADERITPELAASVQAVVTESGAKQKDSPSGDQQAAQVGEPAIWCVQRLNILFGHKMHYGGHRPDWCERLLPRTQVMWTGRVHEGVQSDLPRHRLTGQLEHYTYTTWQQYFAKTNQYTSLSAQGMLAKGKRANGATVISHAVFAFIKSYILKQGVRDGYLGFIMSVLAGVADLMKYLKLQNLARLAQEK